MTPITLTGAQVQTMSNLILFGDRIDIVQAPAGAVLINTGDRRELVIDVYGGFAWRYL